MTHPPGDPSDLVEPAEIADRLAAGCEVLGLAAAVAAGFAVPGAWRWTAGLTVLAAALLALGFGLARR